VFEGDVTGRDETFDETETGLVVGDNAVLVTACEASLPVAFVVDPDAPITRQGTIGL
jgi:hypothetical protein